MMKLARIFSLSLAINAPIGAMAHKPYTQDWLVMEGIGCVAVAVFVWLLPERTA